MGKIEFVPTEDNKLLFDVIEDGEIVDRTSSPARYVKNQLSDKELDKITDTLEE